ncbi:hypothetical protein G6F57_014380 [Rhizopus arrhizus]|nr:hypothetical protein G6F57_014380 [Rhizopus arrhizus]
MRSGWIRNTLMSKAVSINYPSRNAMQAEVEFFRLAPVLCAGVNGAPLRQGDKPERCSRGCGRRQARLGPREGAKATINSLTTDPGSAGSPRRSNERWAWCGAPTWRSPPRSDAIRGVQGRGPEPKPPAQCLNAARQDDFEVCGVR